MSHASQVREVAIHELRRYPPIPSGYTSDRVLRVQRDDGFESLTWHLHEENLPQPFVKQYDDGDIDDLVDLYSESVGAGSMRFLVADDPPAGLLVWAHIAWNNTLWLIDIRVDTREQRRGVGSRLIRVLVEHGHNLGARAITVETQNANVPALRFYRAHGFRVVGLNEALYANDDAERQDLAIFLARTI